MHAQGRPDPVVLGVTPFGQLGTGTTGGIENAPVQVGQRVADDDIAQMRDGRDDPAGASRGPGSRPRSAEPPGTVDCGCGRLVSLATRCPDLVEKPENLMRHIEVIHDPAFLKVAEQPPESPAYGRGVRIRRPPRLSLRDRLPRDARRHSLGRLRPRSAPEWFSRLRKRRLQATVLAAPATKLAATRAGQPAIR